MIFVPCPVIEYPPILRRFRALLTAAGWPSFRADMTSQYTSLPDICYTGNRAKKKNPDLGNNRNAEIFSLCRRPIITTPPSPGSPFPHFSFDVREIYGLHGCMRVGYKRSPKVRASTPTLTICSPRAATLFFGPFFYLPLALLVLRNLFNPFNPPDSVQRGDALPSYRGSVFPGVFGCCLRQEGTHSPTYARPT
jgi:hypothetical protein